MNNDETASSILVPETGIEPVRPLSGKRRILSPLCLPISPLGQSAFEDIVQVKKSADRALKGCRKSRERNNANILAIHSFSCKTICRRLYFSAESCPAKCV
jgi:hypothetical protein